MPSLTQLHHLKMFGIRLRATQRGDKGAPAN